MNACAMVSRCLRHQCPDLLGLGEQPPEAAVPPNLRYGAGDAYPAAPALGEEPMGDPDAVPLDWG